MADDPADTLATLTGKTSPSSYAGFSKSMGDVIAQKEKATAPVEKQTAAALQADTDTSNDAFRKLSETPKDAGPPPKAPTADPWQSWASPAALFGMIAAGFTKTPAVAAMKAATAAINAKKQGDWEEYRSAMDQWKENSDLLIKRHNMMHEDYADAASKMRNDLDVGRQAYLNVAAKYDDQITLMKYQAGLLHDADQISLERQRLADSMATRRDALKMHHEDTLLRLEDQRRMAEGTPAANMRTLISKYVADGLPMAEATLKAEKELSEAKKSPTAASAKEADADTVALDAFKKEHDGKEPGAGDKSEMARLREKARAESGGVMGDDDAKLYAQVALATGHPPAALGRSQANITKFAEAYRREAESKNMSAGEIAANIAKFAGELQQSKSLGTASARIELGASELQVSLPQAMELSEKVFRPGFKKFAEIQQALQGQSNDPDLLEFAQQNQAVINAYAQVMQRGGITTVSGMERAESLLLTATSQTAYMRQLDRLNKEVQTIKYGNAESKQRLLNEISGGSTEVPAPKLTGVPRYGNALGAEKLPMVMQAGKNVPDASKLVGGQRYTLPNGKIATFDSDNQTFHVEQ